MAIESFTPADIFFKHPCVVTNTAWKLEVIVGNLKKLIEKHSVDFTIAFAAGYMDNVFNMPISVVEKDTMIGTPDLITLKATDQVLSMWNMATDPKRNNLVPKEFREIVENGGEYATIATDVAAREVWIDESRESANQWRRVLNFKFSKPTTQMTTKEMYKEMDAYCNENYGSAGRKASRAIDATIGLTHAEFHVRTTVHKKNDKYSEPNVVVFTGKETAGITMGVHPLSDPELRKLFFEEHVERCTKEGKSEKEALNEFDGRAGLGRIEDFIIFCRKHQIDIDLYIPKVDAKDEFEAIRVIAEGGSYNLLAAVILYANTHPYPKFDGKFSVIHEPNDAMEILI